MIEHCQLISLGKFRTEGTIFIKSHRILGCIRPDRVITSLPGLGIQLSDETIATDNTYDVEVTGGMSFALGLMWWATPQLTVAARLDPGYSLDLSIRRQIDRSVTNNDTDSIISSGTDAYQDDAELQYPTRWVIAGAWRFDDARTLTMDMSLVDWSDLTLTTSGGERSAINFDVPASDFDQLPSIRLGYKHILIRPQWVLVPRAGLLYEALPGVTPTTMGSPSARRDDWYGGTLGLSIFRRTFIWDISTQVRHGSGVGASLDAPPSTDADIWNWTIRAGMTIHL